MAVSPLNFQPNTRATSPQIKTLPLFTTPRITTRFLSQYSLTIPRTRNNTSFRRSNLACSSHLSARNEPRGGDDNEEKVIDQVDILKEWLKFMQSALPGGRWWNLFDYEQVSTGTAAKPFTVLNALRRMWTLVADDRWAIYVAFTSLTIAALAEISIPNLLAASIFSAKRGETLMFYRNSHLLGLLCISSGICRYAYKIKVEFVDGMQISVSGSLFLGIVAVTFQAIYETAVIKCLFSHYFITFSGLRSGCFAIVNMNLLKRLRETLYSTLIFQDISFFDKETVGGLTSRLGADCQRLSHVIGNDVHLILRNVIQGVGALINLLILSWPLALSTLLICSVLSTIFLVYGLYQKKAAKVTQDFTACANEVSHETLSLMRTVRAYGTERQEFGRYKLWLDKLAFINMRESAAYGLWNLSFNSLYRLIQVLAILLGGMSIVTGHATPEQLTKYVFYCEWLIYAALRTQDKFSSLLQSVGASEKVFQLMDLLPSDQFLSKGVKLQKLMGHIEFVNVSFHYASRVPILEHVNLSVQADEVVAIVGLSGSGKSTLVNLLLRLYEPIQGQILIDSIPLKELDIRWLRENIGYVGQEPHLFHMDIKSNIMYGCSRDIKQEDVERAAKLAFVHEFISSLPNGYETVVDDELLSGGQKQRIAIARAILRHPAILILDEATSALDAESEYNIQGILHGFVNDMKAKRTVIIIAHRLSTIRAADRIIVMEGGQVVEMGDHGELLRRNGLYTRLNKIQSDALAS